MDPQPDNQPVNPAPLTPREYPQATPTPQAPPTQPFQQPNIAVAEKTTDGLGIASIITSIIGLGLVGFILGLIGASKAKKAGQKPTLSVIGWILGLISTLIVGTIIALLVIVTLSAGSTNKKYLNAVFAKDYDTACALSGENSTKADRTACEKFLDNFNKDYSSYDNNGVEIINNETILNVKYSKKDGGSSTGYISVVDGVVTKFIYGIGDTPSTDEETDSTTTDDAEASVAPTASTDTCLTDADIQGVYTERTDLLQESYGTTDKIFWAESFFFTADSTDYAYPSIMPKYLNMLADVYKNNPDKSFMFELKGSVKEQNATTGGDELAHDRVEKIKSDLVALGVPASRFEEIPPVHTETDYNDDSERNVSVNIVVHQPCTVVGSGR